MPLPASLATYLPACLPAAVEFLEAGLQTTVQDYPGRVALWSVGVPPSGPMDDLSHRWGGGKWEPRVGASSRGSLPVHAAWQLRSLASATWAMRQRPPSRTDASFLDASFLVFDCL